MTSESFNKFEAIKHVTELIQKAENEDDLKTANNEMLAYLTSAYPSNAIAFGEPEGWGISLPGLPITGDGVDFDEAIEDTIAALRDYSEAWFDHLSTAPNHEDNLEIAQIILLSSDEQLRDWLLTGY